tara:strand:+ start:713 stop:1894 length:1182 start_codon:yes stop_codon:yes gene_type:complete
MKLDITDSITRLEGWLKHNNYKGYEYYDGLTSVLRFITFGNWFAERLLIQFFKRMPFNFRPVFGVRQLESTKGMGFIAKGYLNLWKETKNDVYRKKAEYFLNWLVTNHSKGYSGYCWGNSFDHASGAFQLPKNSPTLVWSGLIGHVFLNAYELFQEKKYLNVAESICTFISKDIERTEYEGTICLSYVTFKKLPVHNANMIGSSLLARVYKYNGDKRLKSLAEKSMTYSCNAQLKNGAWLYSEAPNGNWIDNWHTAYNLDALKHYIDSIGDSQFEKKLIKGYSFYKQNFFLKNGKPKYYYNRLRWADIQSAAQAIDTFCFFSEFDDDAIQRALNVANWTIKNMQHKNGYFYYRDLGWKKVKIPMIHWGQATMFSALSNLIQKTSDSVFPTNEL